MCSFEEELERFLAAYDLPPLTRCRADGWVHFLYLYIKVVEDIPLAVAVPATRKKLQAAPAGGVKHVSHVTVNCEEAREPMKHEHGEDLFFKVTWTIHDKNGQSGSVFILNSVSLQAYD